MLLATIALCAIFCVHNIHSFDDSTGNIHVMKSEIEKAMEDCGETNSSAENTKAEFQKKSSILLLVQNNPKHETTHNQRNGEDGEMNLTRRRRNINLLAELASRFLQEKLDDNSGDWDYGGGVGTEDSNNDSNNNRGKNQRNNGQSWDDPKDDMSVMDSIYSHNRRNNSNSYSRGNDNSQSGRGNSLQDQNSTRINPNTMGNNFDSRGARFHSAAGFRKLMDDRVYRSVKDLNKTSNFYDPFMTRGIRSVGKNTIRKKRYDRLTKIANENECLSQCVFTNLQIVDDRGIPKEGLFSKLMQDSVTSQQSRVKLEDQMKACFRQLITESEDNGCSYSNALDRCMGLELRKRKSLINEHASSKKIR